MKNRPEPQVPAPRASSQGGFSLIEVLVASMLLLFIALGLVPLFTRAMVDNANGHDATTATNFDRTQLETLYGLPMDRDATVIPNGQTMKETQDYFWTGDMKTENDSKEGWHTTLPTGSDPGTTRWRRFTRVRQYAQEDLDDNGVLDTPLDGSTPFGNVHFKEFEVVVQGMNSGGSVLGNLLGGGPQVTFRTLKSF